MTCCFKSSSSSFHQGALWWEFLALGKNLSHVVWITVVVFMISRLSCSGDAVLVDSSEVVGR